MNVAIIDAEIIGKSSHRFPNLACMKLSAYYKKNNNIVDLVYNYADLFSFGIEENKYTEENKKRKQDTPWLYFEEYTKNNKSYTKYYYEEQLKYEKICLSKVFTNTYYPEKLIDLNCCDFGGTGFYYENAPDLPEYIEHIMPDYHLYDKWIEEKIKEKIKGKSEEEKEKILKNCTREFTYYKDYSIGFLTRGCFRQCEFCVNKNKTKCVKHSPISEFLDNSRPKLCFLDDNFFACPQWKTIIQEVKKTGKYFQFKQGLDERLLTDDKIHEIVSWKYEGRKIFAFDNIQDKKLIESKLQRMLQLYPKSTAMTLFYVLVGYDRENKWDKEFWLQDIKNAFERCFILATYSAVPYVMRYEACYTSEFISFYNNLAAWTNQAAFFRKRSFYDFCIVRGMDSVRYKKYKNDYKGYLLDGGKKGASWRMLEEFEKDYPDIVDKYFHIVPDSLSIVINN